MTCTKCGSNHNEIVYERRQSSIGWYFLTFLFGAASLNLFKEGEIVTGLVGLAITYGCWYKARENRNTVLSYRCNNPQCGNQWDEIVW